MSVHRWVVTPVAGSASGLDFGVVGVLHAVGRGGEVALAAATAAAVHAALSAAQGTVLLLLLESDQWVQQQRFYWPWNVAEVREEADEHGDEKRDEEADERVQVGGDAVQHGLPVAGN